MQEKIICAGFTEPLWLPTECPFGFTDESNILTNILLRKVGQGGYDALGGDAVAGAETAGLVDLHLWGFCTNILYSAL